LLSDESRASLPLDMRTARRREEKKDRVGRRDLAPRYKYRGDKFFMIVKKGE